MKIEIIILMIVLALYIIYRVYFRNYFRVRKNFKILGRFLDARDTLVLKAIPEINDDKLVQNIMKLIEERKLNFKSSQNNAILADIKLNQALKDLYEKYNQKEKNELEKELFANVLKLEQNLKLLRKEYNTAVDTYNMSLVKHKLVSFKLIRMKPLDTYKSLTNG